MIMGPAASRTWACALILLQVASVSVLCLVLAWSLSLMPFDSPAVDQRG